MDEQEVTRKEGPPGGQAVKRGLQGQTEDLGTIEDEPWIPDPGFFLPPSMGLLSNHR